MRNSEDQNAKGAGLACIGLGPKALAAFMPDHDSMGTGAFHRKSPTGGFAKGIPRNFSTFVAGL